MIYFAKWLLTKHARAVIAVAGLVIAAAPIVFDFMIMPLPRFITLDLIDDGRVCGMIDEFLKFCAVSPIYRRIEQGIIAAGMLIFAGGAYSAWRAKRRLRQNSAEPPT